MEYGIGWDLDYGQTMMTMVLSLCCLEHKDPLSCWWCFSLLFFCFMLPCIKIDDYDFPPNVCLLFKL